MAVGVAGAATCRWLARACTNGWWWLKHYTNVKKFEYLKKIKAKILWKISYRKVYSIFWNQVKNVIQNFFSASRHVHRLAHPSATDAIHLDGTLGCDDGRCCHIHANVVVNLIVAWVESRYAYIVGVKREWYERYSCVRNTLEWLYVSYFTKVVLCWMLMIHSYFILISKESKNYQFIKQRNHVVNVKRERHEFGF